MKIKSLSGPELVRHMGAHILFDFRVKGGDNPCGFCLSFGNSCQIILQRGQGAASVPSIDMERSRCPNLRRLRIKHAMEFTQSNPCTNHPLLCPVCSAVVWKYNLELHLSRDHPTSNPGIYEDAYALANNSANGLTEIRCMEAAYNTVPRSSKKTSKASKLAVSLLHTSNIPLNE